MVFRWPRPLVAARARGAALIMLMALLAMGVLYFVTVQLEAVSLYQREAEKSGSGNSMVQAREALLGYAATYRDNNPGEVFGYLPCPDTDGNGESESTCGTSGEASIGLLPYKTLGLSDLRDSSGGCLWYAVAGNFKNNPKATSAMNWDTQGQFSVIDANGAVLVVPDDSRGGAAAVIFAAGAPLAAQNRSASAAAPCNIDPAQVTSYLDGAYTFATANTISLTQGTVKDAGGSVTNNDRLNWITPKEIFDRVIKRQDFSNALSASPPGQVNTLLDRIKAALELKIQTDIFAGGTVAASLPMNTANYTPKPSGISVGEVDPTMDIGLTGQSSYASYLTNWAEQYRQAVCDDVTLPCLDINNSGTANCRGALLLGGRTANGQPRMSAQKGSSLSILANYFESGSTMGGLDLLTGSGKFSGRTAYAEAIALANASWSGGIASVTTAAAHGFASDFYVTISGALPSGYNGTYKIAVTDTTHFTFALGANPGAYVSGGNAYSLSADVAACLGSGTYVSSSKDIADFASGVTYSGATPIASVDTVTKTVTLGDTGGGAGAGCVWYPTAISLGSSLRLYYRFRINTKGDGYALVLADGATNLAPGNATRTQIMCGSTGSTRMGYAGSPSGSAPGIQQPKIGIEFDSFYSSTRNDPPGDHMAFLYWGTASDSDGSDDNTHYLGNGSAAITNATWANGTATLTTASAHGLTAGQVVLVSGLDPSGYNGTVTVSSPTGTQFSYAVASNPGAYATGGRAKAISTGNAPRNPRVATATRNAPVSVVASDTYLFTTRTTSYSASSQRVSIVTSSPHGLSVGDQVVVSGIDPAGYNGTFKVSNVNTTRPYRFRYYMSSDPGNYVSGGAANKVMGTELSELTWAGATASATTPVAHGMTDGQNVTSFGMTPSGFGTMANLTYVDTKHFTFPLATDPGGTFSTENPPGMAMVKQTDTHLPYSAFPTGTYIYVRLDLTRNYDIANHVAVLDMKAYIGNTFPLGDACTSTEFQNLSRDLSTLCPSRTVTLQQDSIPIGALATLSNAVWSSGTGLVTVTTAAAHGLVNGASVTIAGATPSTYNGAITATVTGTNTFTYAATNPGAYVSGGDVLPLSTIYLGFTNARGSSNSGENQNIWIRDLLMRSQ